MDERKKYFIAIMSVMLLISLFFNNKLNAQFLEIKSTNANKDEVIKNKYEIKDEWRYPIPKNYDVKANYFLLSGIDTIKKEYNKDEKGTLLTKWKLDGKNENVYHPVAIAQLGLKTMALYKNEKDEEWKKIALAQADFFVENMNEKNQWEYSFDFEVAKETLKAPWSSAMATGQVLSLLSRAYIETGDEKYLEICKKSLKPLSVDVKDGGFEADFFGHVWYEEYPTEIPSFTLNGFMFTIIGLHDYWEITKDKEALSLYNEGIKTLEYALPFFDSDGISLYHLGHIFNKGYPITINNSYHSIHVLELGVIRQWEENEIIEYYYDEWTDYMK